MMNNIEIRMFISGTVFGVIIGSLGTYGIFKRKEKKIEKIPKKSLTKEYDDIVDKYRRKDHNEKTFEEEEIARPGGRMTPEERREIKEKLKKNYEQTTNYAKMYKEVNKQKDPAESEYPKENDEEEHISTCMTCDHNKGGYCDLIEESVNDEETCSDWEEIQDDQKEETPEEEAFDEHRKNMNKPPRIISAEDYSNLPTHIDQEVLYYYAYDEMLCDENEEPVDEPSALIGDALEKYGFADNDELVIFVMNYTTDTCYEIQKLDSSWTDTH